MTIDGAKHCAQRPKTWKKHFHALQLGEASRVAPVDKLKVACVIAFAALFPHEKLMGQQWVDGEC